MVRRISFHMSAQCLRDDMLTVTGKVSRKYRGLDGSYLIDLADLNVGTETAKPALARAIS